MFEGKFHLLTITGLLAGFSFSSVWAGDFAMPAEGPVAFRRDQVPLEADGMAELSEHLTFLADGLAAKTAVERRGAAQMLALSIALDPGNTKARRLLDDFSADKHQPDADAGKIQKSRTRIWQFIAWLETAEAGTQGQALAACLKDVILLSDPKDPRVQALSADGERGAWAGWIPQLSAYEVQETPETAPPDSTPETTPSGPALVKAQVGTPLWKADAAAGPGKWTLAVAPLHMTVAREVTDPAVKKPFELIIGSPSGAGTFSPLSGQILKLLRKQHGNLPTDTHVTLGGDELEASQLSKKRQSISAAAAVLASSAVTGREPDAIIIGTIDETGAFTLPDDFWDQLQALGTGTGGRLVLPAAAAEYLPSMLALEKPGIFFEYEILLAADFKELLDLTAKTPDGTLGKVSHQFKEIREKSVSQQVGPYVGNPFIRRRLLEITQEAPYHYSAKMLAVQGAGNRPVFVLRPVLVSELRRAIEPMEWVVKHTSSSYEDKDIAELGVTYETCRSRVDGLSRYVDKSDRELLTLVQEMVSKLRPLERAAKSRGYSYDVADAVATAHMALLRANAEVAEQLMGKSGGADVEPVR